MNTCLISSAECPHKQSLPYSISLFAGGLEISQEILARQKTYDSSFPEHKPPSDPLGSEITAIQPTIILLASSHQRSNTFDMGTAGRWSGLLDVRYSETR